MSIRKTNGAFATGRSAWALLVTLVCAAGPGCGLLPTSTPDAGTAAPDAGAPFGPGPCPGGTPMQATLATGIGITHDLLLVGEQVYWLDTLAGTISRVHRCGGAVETLATGVSEAYHLSASATELWWGLPNLRRIGHMPLDGGAITEHPVALPLPDYVVEHAGLLWIGHGQGLATTDLDGTNVQRLWGANSAAMIRIDGDTVFWAANGSGIMSRPLAGTELTIVTNAPGDRFVLTHDWVVIPAMADRTLYRDLRRGGAKSALYQGIPADAVADEAFIYFVDGPENAIARIPLARGMSERTDVVTGVSARRLALDADFLYWIDEDGTLGRQRIR